MKKLFAVLVALTLVLSMGTMAFAADGSITISNAISGEEYKIYKMLDFAPSNEDGDKGVYTIAEGWKDFFAAAPATDYFTVTEYADKTTVSIKEGVTAVDQTIAQAAVAYAAGKTATKTAIADGTTVKFEGLDLGYYAIDTSIGTLCALTNTNSDETVYEKNTEPKIDKKIVETAGLVDANNVAIGDKVDYQSVVTAGKGTVNYVVHDTFSSGLTFDDESVVVTYKGEALVAGENNDYVLTTACDDGCTFEIDFSDAFEATLKESDEIIITYSATLNDGAVIGSTGNPNEIHLTYGNAQTTTKDTVITYTTKLTIDKTDAQGIALPGAGFTLYKDEVKDANKVGAEITGVTTFEWKGLEEGKYILVETTVPDGYNKAKDIEFVIECTEPEVVASATDTAVWSTESNDITAENASVFKGTVVNNTGALLPETGGIGTTIFYVVGGLLMVAAFVLLVSKKRMASFA